MIYHLNNMNDIPKRYYIERLIKVNRIGSGHSDGLPWRRRRGDAKEQLKLKN